MDSQNHRRARFALPALIAAAATGALAQEPNPWYVGASQDVTYDSNFFRVAEGAPESKEVISTTSLLAGLNQPIGRQRLFADLALRHSFYDKRNQFDHTGGNLLAGIDWEAADLLSGRVAYTTDRTLARYGDEFGFFEADGRVMQTRRELNARGQVGGASLLAVELGYIRRELEFSKPGAPDQFDQNTGSIGLKYRPSGALTLGLAFRRTDGTYPNAPAPVGGGTLADDFDRDDIDLSAVWSATGASTVTARVSRTKEEHKSLTIRDFKGTTGAVAWAYKLTGKSGLFLDWIRDTSSENSFNAGAGGAVVPTVVTSRSPLSTTWQLRGEYEALAKVKAIAQVRYLKRDLVDTTGAKGDDNLVETRVGLNWTPLRSVTVGCSVGHEKRDASSALSTSYSATTAQCLAEFRTQ